MSNNNKANFAGRTTLALFSLATLLISATPALAEDSIYRDPRQPSFTLLVPDGWRAEPNDRGVTLMRDSSYFMLSVSPGGSSPGAMLVRARPQVERQWQQFRETESGATMFGGKNASYASYAGTPPSSLSSTLKIVTMDNGALAFTAFEGIPKDNLSRDKQDMERIERSFTPD